MKVKLKQLFLNLKSTHQGDDFLKKQTDISYYYAIWFAEWNEMFRKKSLDFFRFECSNLPSEVSFNLLKKK